MLSILIFVGCSSPTKEQQTKIIGKWVGDIRLPKTGKFIGKMYLQFTKDGEFFQRTGEGKEQVVSRLTYRLGRDKIFYKGKVTGGKEFDSGYAFKGDTLVMRVDGEKCDYLRIR